MVDDKLRILAAIKKIWNEGVTTVFVRQGHYAHDPKITAACPPADLAFDQIGDLLNAADLWARFNRTPGKPVT